MELNGKYSHFNRMWFYWTRREHTALSALSVSVGRCRRLKPLWMWVFSFQHGRHPRAASLFLFPVRCMMTQSVVVRGPITSTFTDKKHQDCFLFFFKDCAQIPVWPHDESSLVTDAKISTRCEGHDLQIIGLKRGWGGFFHEPCAFLASVTKWLAVRPLEEKQKEEETHTFRKHFCLFRDFKVNDIRLQWNKTSWCRIMTSDLDSDLILWFSDRPVITAAERECELRLLERVNFVSVQLRWDRLTDTVVLSRLLHHLFLSMQLQIHRSSQAASPCLTLLH